MKAVRIYIKVFCIIMMCVNKSNPQTRHYSILLRHIKSDRKGIKEVQERLKTETTQNAIFDVLTRTFVPLTPLTVILSIIMYVTWLNKEPSILLASQRPYLSTEVRKILPDACARFRSKFETVVDDQGGVISHLHRCHHYVKYSFFH